VHVVNGIFAESIARGADPAELCASFGISPAELADSDARIGVDVVRRLWAELPERLGAEDLGLDVARRARASGALGVVGYVLGTSATLGDALRSALRYQRLVTDAVRTRWTERGDVVRVTFVDVDPAYRLPRHAVEFGVAAVLESLRAAAKVSLAPSRVAFRHARPHDEARARAAFGCETRYGAEENAVEFAVEDLTLPLATADANLAALLLRHAARLAEGVPERATFATRVRRALAEGLSGDGTSLGRVATYFGSSPRTVQRRLREEGTSFQRVLDDLRRDLALDYIERPNLDLVQVAFLLGFADQSSFHHAFVRWTGEAPGAYRRRRRR